MDRRTLLATLAVAPCAGAAAPAIAFDRLRAAIVAEEAALGGRIGIALLCAARSSSCWPRRS